MNQRIILTLFLVFVGLQVLWSQHKPTEVIVIGTIHAQHSHNPNYTYRDLLRILYSYQPDAICVEISQKDFRKNTYLREMELASVYGFVEGKAVYPIDWAEIPARKERQEYLKTRKYKTKKALEDSLIRNNYVINRFDSIYGGFQKYSKKMDYSWFQSKVYNNYCIEYYNISMNVYGDHCMNLYYRTRNDSMMNYINKAIDKHIGERVIIFTGAEHKHYFDRALSQRADVNLIDFKNVELCQNLKPDPKVGLHLLNRDPTVYLEKASTEYKFRWIYKTFSPLIHYRGMDFRPKIIPKENIDSAAKILTSLEIEYRNLPNYRFEKGWLNFLQGNYEEAIQDLSLIISDTSRIIENSKWWIVPSIYRIQGYCFDLMNQREKALKMYKIGRETSLRYRKLPEEYLYALFDKWIEQPYRNETE